MGVSPTSRVTVSKPGAPHTHINHMSQGVRRRGAKDGGGGRGWRETWPHNSWL